MAIADLVKKLGMLTLGAPRAGKHGYLLFENPTVDANAELVDGASLGKLLVENDVPTLVLNACQSAMADPAPTPTPTLPRSREQRTGEGVADSPSATGEGTVGEQIRAFGSLAQEVMDTGVAGVVAMRYVLYVETAKKFVADLYGALVQGQSLGEAVTFGRKQLAANPQREIAYKPINLQDWSVPIVYETAAIKLFPDVRAQHAAPLPEPLLPNVLPGSLGAIVRSFKSATTKRINASRDTAGAPVWHRNYYEHIIRNERSLSAIREYISGNPASWADDEENPVNMRAKA